jgi:putative oxidoreductase
MARGGGLEAYGALILRVTLGVVFIAHAYRLLFVWGPLDLAAFQRTYGLPFPSVTFWYAALAFGIGGACLVLGVLVRWAALSIVPVLAVAAFALQGRPGMLVDRGGAVDPALIILMATLAQACLGPGAFTLRR